MAEVQYWVKQTWGGQRREMWVGDSQLDDSCEFWVSSLLAGTRNSRWAKASDLDATWEYYARYDRGTERAISFIKTPPTFVGVTYYVSNNGSDAADGLSAATAWRTLAKVGGFTFASGNRVVLRRADRWKETLAVPRSGLTFGAWWGDPILDADGYCTNAPVIDGGEFVTGWTTYNGGVTDSYVTDDFAGTSGNDITGSAPEVGVGAWVSVNGLGQSVFSSDGCARRGNAAATSMYIAGPKPVAANYRVTANVRIKTLLSVDSAQLVLMANPSGQGYLLYAFGGLVTVAGTNTFRLSYSDSTGTTLVDNPVTFSAGTDRKVAVELVGTTLNGYLDDVLVATVSVAQTRLGVFQGAPGEVGYRIGSSSTPVGADATGMQLIDFDCSPLGAPGTPANTYKATAAADPKLVELRSEMCATGLSPNLLQNKQKFWAGGILYVRSDAGIPSDTDVIGGLRVTGITVGANANTVIQDIGFEHLRGSSVQFASVTSGGQLRRLMTQRSGGDPSGGSGVYGFSGAHTNPIVDGCVVRHTELDGVWMTNPVSPLVQNCVLITIDGTIGDGVQIAATGTTVNGVFRANRFLMANQTSPKGGLILFGDGMTVDGNYFEAGNNFGVSCVGSNYTIVNNVFLRCGSGGAIRVTDNTGLTMDNHLVHHNVIIDALCALFVDTSGTPPFNRTNFKYYANTIVNAAVPPSTAVQNGYGTGQVHFTQPIGGEFKDNIIWNRTGVGRALLLATITGSWASDYNLIGPEASNFLSFTGTQYSTLAAYVAGKTQDATSRITYPKFVNPGGQARDGSAYRPAPGSPAVGTGVLVSGIVAAPPHVGALAP